jgi:SAM-dependent methyltransferase
MSPSAANHTYDAAFAEYYDRITTHKDYRAEVNALARLIRQTAPSAEPQVLDVGCGTGSHAALLAESGYAITAIDPSPEMASRARAKAPGATVESCEVSRLDAGPFDFACALFNVVNCLSSLDALTSFFGDVADRLVPGGVFLVEAWNPIAVIATPPETVERTYETETERITRKVVPRPDFLNQRLDLDYHIAVEQAAGQPAATSFTVTHELVLFTPLEVSFCLTQAGFADVAVRTALPELAPASADDRMLAFTAERKA